MAISNLCSCLGGRSGYFLFYFSARGRGRESPEVSFGGGVRFFIENPRRRVSREGKGAEGPGGCVRGELGNWGGGLNISFRGRNVHQAAPFRRMSLWNKDWLVLSFQLLFRNGGVDVPSAIRFFFRIAGWAGQMIPSQKYQDFLKGDQTRPGDCACVVELGMRTFATHLSRM